MARGAGPADVRCAGAEGGAPLITFGVLGDVHACFDEADVPHLDACGYDAILAVGDLADRLHLRTLAVARRMAALRTPLLVLPGNHDATSPLDVLREAVGPPLNRRRRPARLAHRMTQRVAELQAALHPHTLCGYSLHTVSRVSRVSQDPHAAHAGHLPAVDVIAARPHAMDGRHLTFAAYLDQAFQVPDLEASAAKLRALVDQARHPIVFLAHNGPAGFGASGPWGLRRPPRDNGDPDLAGAVTYARASGKRVLAAVAGHMHLDATRPWRAERDGVLFANAARVPRIEGGPAPVRHHLRLSLGTEGWDAAWVRA